MSDSADFLNSKVGKAPEDLNASERRVIERAERRAVVTTDINAALAAKAGFGDRLADSIARVGGSWSFIIGFGTFLVLWVLLNAVVLVSNAFDPYPFVFLNLILSMIAAVQAPIIMMSQNRQAARDRFAAAMDYEVNLKAELEVLSLHHKIDKQVLKEIKALREEVKLLAERLDVNR